MKKIIAISWLVITSACAVLPSTQPPRIQNTTTPRIVIQSSPVVTVVPTEIYLIPEQEPPDRIFAALPKSSLTGVSDEVIAHLLLEKFLNQQMKDDVKINKIIDYEITEFRLQVHGNLHGRFFSCYIMTPASKEFIMSTSRKLEDGRIEVCNVFGVSKDTLLYYLSGYYGG